MIANKYQEEKAFYEHNGDIESQGSLTMHAISQAL